MYSFLFYKIFILFAWLVLLATVSSSKRKYEKECCESIVESFFWTNYEKLVNLQKRSKSRHRREEKFYVFYFSKKWENKKIKDFSVDLYINLAGRQDNLFSFLQNLLFFLYNQPVVFIVYRHFLYFPSFL